MNPVGPEEPGVYWRRRAIVIGVIILVLIFLWWLLFGRGGGSDAAPTPAPTSSSSSASPSASGSSSATSTASPSPSTASASPTGSIDIKECADDNIMVEASAEMAIYPVGSTPQLTLKITNIGTTPCKRDVGPAANELRIESGDYGLWSSDDCNPSDESDVKTLDRGDTYETQLIWDGRTSQAGCPPDQPIVEAGEYSVVGRNGDVESVPSGLRLE